ncbi:reverse transcriptase family protein [Spirosoma gilvum]
MTRQEIYDRIRSLGSKDSFVLAEMKRLGFWERSASMPAVSEQFIEHEAQLQRELNNLLDKQRRYENRKAMLAEMRKARMVESKRKQQETKQRNEQKRQERAARWKAQQQQAITYIGEGVSAGLQPTVSDKERLARFGVPDFESPLALAQALDMTLGRLRFLTFNRPVSTVSHYKRFFLSKKSGGKRLISAPMPYLKKAQYWVLAHILQPIQPTEEAHGFVTNRSIVTNAQPHIGQDVVVNLDLKDFFPSISYRRIKGLFVAFGYAETIATLLALLCTEPAIDEVELDGKRYYVAKGERILPQGAPTSPGLTNLLAYRLDHRLRGIADKFGFAYTRYADDLTFSASGEAAGRVGQLLWSIRQVINSEGFTLHPDKLQVMRKGAQQRVTGLIVNDQLGIDRATLRKFRALLHQIEQTGWANKTWGKGQIQNTVLGYANFVAMVKPEQGEAMREKVKVLLLTAPNATTVRPERESKSDKETLQKPQMPNTSVDWWDVL